MQTAAVLLLTSALLLVTCSGDLRVTSPTASLPTVTSAGTPTEPAAPAGAGAAPAGAAAGAVGAAAAGSVVEVTELETATAEVGPAATVSCQDELHCHCALGNGTVAVQCRYGDQNVVLRWNVLASHPSPNTRFEIDLQTRGAVKVLPSFLDLKLRPPADGKPSVMFIIRDATLVDALYASDKTFPTEWHLDRVTLRSLNGEQLCPAPHRLLLTVRDSQVGVLRLPPLPPGTRLTLDSCQVSEVTGLPPPLATAPPPPPEAATDRPEVIVRKCTLDTLRTAAISIEDVAGQNPPSLLFAGNTIGEMEQAAITVRSPSCQLTFIRNEVHLLQREVFSVAGGALRLSNNTLHVPHTAALRGFCGQINLNHNDVRVPPAFGALHFDSCVRYTMLGNTFQCPCDGVGWLAMFERRQRPSVVEVFYERLLKDSFCSTPGGRVPMAEFALLEDCSGAGLRSTLVLVTAVLAAVVPVLLLALVLCWCCHRRSSTKLHPPRLRRPKNLYSSDISAPISKSVTAAAAGRPATAPSSASLSALSGVDARQLGHYVTLESDEDDAVYATIVYKKRRAPVPPPGSTPRPRRVAPPGVLNRCVSEGGIRLPVYSSLQHLPARKLSGAGTELRRVDGPPEGIAEEVENPYQVPAEEVENPYLVPDGTASIYVELPPPQLYEEIIPTEEEGDEVRSGWAAPQQGKTSKDSGIGDDFCLEAMPQEVPTDLGADVYSPAVRPRRP